MNVTFLRKSVGSLQIVALLAVGFAGFIPAKTNAATPTETNLAYFKAHKYTIPLDGSDIPDIGATHDPFAAEGGTDVSTGGLNVAAAFKSLHDHPEKAVILDQATFDVVRQGIINEELNIHTSLSPSQITVDYNNYAALLKSFEKNNADNDAFQKTSNNQTILRVELSNNSSWADKLLTAQTGLLTPNELKDIKANIDNTSPATYWQKIQTKRQSIDRSLAHIYVYAYLLHSKNPTGTTDAQGGLWRASADALAVQGQTLASGEEAPALSLELPTKNSDGSIVYLTKTYTTLSGFLKDWDPYDQEGLVAKPIDAIGQVSSEAQQTNGESLKGNSRCGSSPLTTNIGNLLLYAGCAMTDIFAQFADSLLLSAGQLITYTAGIPDSAIPSQLPEGYHFNSQNRVSSFWCSALPSDVRTPFQTLMVDQTSDVGKTVASTQKVIVNLLNILLVLVFIGVAILNILQIQVNTYGIRKLIPAIVVGFILAQFSFFLIRGALEVVGQVSNGLIGFATQGSTDPSVKSSVFQNYVDTFAKVRGPSGNECLTVTGTPGTCSGDINNGKVFQQFVLNLFVVVGAILLFVLGFIFGARVFIFTIAVPLTPLAVFCRSVPPLVIVWTRWSKTVIQWIIMPIPAMGMLLLSSLFFTAANRSTDHLAGNNNVFGFLLDYVAGIIFLFYAIKIPFSFAGEAKGFLEKYNAYGGNLAKRYTPYGAGLRAKAKIEANTKQRDAALLSGDVVKNGLLRKAGGNTINRALARQKLSLDKDDELQKGLSEKVVSEAEKQLQEGYVKTAAGALSAVSGLEKFGKALDTLADRSGKLGQKFGINGNSYQNATDRVSQLKLDTESLKADSGFTGETRFINGGNMSAAERRFTDLINLNIKNGGLDAKDQKEAELLAKKLGLNSAAVFTATASGAGVTPAARAALAKSTGIGRLISMREAHDSTAYSRREQIAKSAGLKKAQENKRSEAEGRFATERVFDNKQFDVAKKLLKDDTNIASVPDRTKAFTILSTRRNKDEALEKILSSRGINSEADLNNVANRDAIREYFIQKVVDNVEDGEAEDGTNKELVKKVVSNVQSKQTDRQYGDGAELALSAAGPGSPQLEVFTKLLDENTSMLDMKKFTPTDVTTAEQNLGAAAKGLFNEDAGLANAKAIKGIVNNTGLTKFNGTNNGIPELDNYIDVLENRMPGTTTPILAQDLNNLLRQTRVAYNRTQLSKVLSKMTVSPDKLLAS